MLNLSDMKFFLEDESKRLGLKIIKFGIWYNNKKINLDLLVERQNYQIANLSDCSTVNKLALLWLKNASMVKLVNLSVGVSSIDRPLFEIEDYKHYIGEKIDVSFNQLVLGRKKIRGFIKSVEYDLIVLKQEEGEFRLSQVERAKLAPDWDKIMKRQR